MISPSSVVLVRPPPSTVAKLLQFIVSVAAPPPGRGRRAEERRGNPEQCREHVLVAGQQRVAQRRSRGRLQLASAAPHAANDGKGRIAGISGTVGRATDWRSSWTRSGAAAWKQRMQNFAVARPSPRGSCFVVSSRRSKRLYVCDRLTQFDHLRQCARARCFKLDGHASGALHQPRIAGFRRRGSVQRGLARLCLRSDAARVAS